MFHAFILSYHFVGEKVTKDAGLETCAASDGRDLIDGHFLYMIASRIFKVHLQIAIFRY